ncbi:MAG: hypothetical protein II942_04375 [Alphaproteobacteria bacterium]|nr:hypothetical protein [Alphaproteobacteria bacterium]
MKYVTAFLLSLGITASVCHAQTDRVYTEAEQMGTLAGLAYACGSKQKLKDFELIAAHILADKSATSEEAEKKLQQFNKMKYRYMKKQKDSPRMSCKEVLEHFNNMPIFQSTVYADGTVKMFDGTILKPQYPIIKVKVRQ